MAINFFFFQPADEVTVHEVLKCTLKMFLGDPSSLPRTANLLEILGSVTVSYTFLLNNYNIHFDILSIVSA